MKDLSTEEDKLRQQIRELTAYITALEKRVANVTHDLKTPLTGVKLFSDILLSQAEDSDTGASVKYAAMISVEAERMSRMIANIVDIENVSSGKAAWHDDEVDLVKLADMCARPFKRWCEAKGIGFSYTTDVECLVVPVDADRFSRLVSGLLANAFRFTETGTVKLALKSKNAKFCLAVSDTGSGICEERLEALFSLPMGAPDMGKDIGLAFACAVVDHYQGQIWADSVVENGSIFYVELPLLGAKKLIEKTREK